MSSALDQAVLLVKRLDVFHVLGGAQEHRRSLVKVFGLGFQDSSFAVERAAAGVLHDVRHRIALVQQPQLAVRRRLGGRIQKNAAILDRSGSEKLAPLKPLKTVQKDSLILKRPSK